MINERAYINLCAKGILVTDTIKRLPTFEELWAKLPVMIKMDGQIYYLEMWKMENYDAIRYLNHHSSLNIKIGIEISNSSDKTQSLSDLVAEMLITLKEKDML